MAQTRHPLLKLSYSKPLEDLLKASLDEKSFYLLESKINLAFSRYQLGNLVKIFSLLINDQDFFPTFISMLCKLNPNPDFHFQLFAKLLFVLSQKGNEYLLKNNAQALAEIIYQVDIKHFKQNLLSFLEGVRTACADDYLTLLYAECFYMADLVYYVENFTVDELVDIFTSQLIQLVAANQDLQSQPDQQKKNQATAGLGLVRSAVADSRARQVKAQENSEQLAVSHACSKIYTKEYSGREKSYQVIFDWLQNKTNLNKLLQGECDQLAVEIINVFNAQNGRYFSELDLLQSAMLRGLLDNYQHPIVRVLHADVSSLVMDFERRINRLPAVQAKLNNTESSESNDGSQALESSDTPVSLWCSLHNQYAKQSGVENVEAFVNKL